MMPMTIRLRLEDSCTSMGLGAVGNALEADELPKTVVLFASSTPFVTRTIHDSLFVDSILFQPMADAVAQATASRRR